MLRYQSCCLTSVTKPWNSPATIFSSFNTFVNKLDHNSEINLGNLLPEKFTFKNVSLLIYIIHFFTITRKVFFHFACNLLKCKKSSLPPNSNFASDWKKERKEGRRGVTSNSCCRRTPEGARSERAVLSRHLGAGSWNLVRSATTVDNEHQSNIYFKNTCEWLLEHRIFIVPTVVEIVVRLQRSCAFSFYLRLVSWHAAWHTK